MSTLQFINFADSEVVTVISENVNILIRLSAAHVLRNDPTNASKSVEGFAREVELMLSGVKPNQPTNELIGRIFSGRVLMKNQWTPQIPLPCTLSGPIKLELTFANQSHLEIEANSLECRFEGEANFFESMAC
jgi:hypothetical protein